jgi:hypothetical protein
MYKLQALPYTEVHSFRANCGHPVLVPVRTTVRAKCYGCIHGITQPQAIQMPKAVEFSFRSIELPAMPLASKQMNKTLAYKVDSELLPVVQ